MTTEQKEITKGNIFYYKYEQNRKKKRKKPYVQTHSNVSNSTQNTNGKKKNLIRKLFKLFRNIEMI